jgi:hypothetical protein
VTKTSQLLGSWPYLLLFALLKYFSGNIGIGEAFFQMRPNLFWRFNVSFNEGGQIDSVYHEDTERIYINPSLLLPFMDEFPVIGGDFNGKFAQMPPLLAAPGEQIITEIENTAENGCGCAANHGGNQGDGSSVSWHEVNMVLLAWVAGYAGGALLLMIVAYMLEKRREHHG